MKIFLTVEDKLKRKVLLEIRPKLMISTVPKDRNQVSNT